MIRAASVLVAVASVASVACTIGETRYEKLYLPVLEAEEGPSVCGTDDWVKPDLSELEECGDGQGHCYDAKKISHGDGFEKCKKPGEVCIADSVLRAGGKKLKSCTSIAGVGNKGACVNIDLIPEMKAQGAGVLKQDVCDDKQVCAPCTNPLANNAPTGFCEEMGVHENDCKGGGAATEVERCCHGMGACLEPEGVPADSRDQLDKQECSDARICAPASLVTGKPAKCTVAGLDGVCVDTCFAGMLTGTAKLTRTDCQVTEVCIPCVVGKSQGMPGC